MNILGIWDGHDAGAALLVDGRLVAAANEERFTRRKLEIAFPEHSIAACLSTAGLAPRDVAHVALSTSDPAKAIGRLWPRTKESYYRQRRRLGNPGPGASLRTMARYHLSARRPTWWSKALSRATVGRALRAAGLGRAPFTIHDHHEAHAVAAACASPFPSCTVLTIDGVGDGCSATVYRYRDGRLELLARTLARDSPGWFFEHVTALLNMRELEDEGKVMALADYAAPVDDDRNPLLALFATDGLQFRARVACQRMRPILKRHLWSTASEQFAYMAQRALEHAVVTLVERAVEATGEPRVALAGGVASNVRINRSIRLSPRVDDVFVFPHMGDGGLAVGAALLASANAGCAPKIDVTELGLGPDFTEDAMLGALKAAGVPFHRPGCLSEHVAALLAEGRVVLWFQGRMEYGPRALGHRSILCRADRIDLRDRLNLVLKRRVWYQPFCPAVLERDACVSFADWKGLPNRHMTMAYRVKREWHGRLAGAIHVDGTCRPQIVSETDTTPFGALLHEVRRQVGIGAVLNTSFNIHGRPLVCTPEDAVSVFLESKADALALGPFVAVAP